MCSCEKLYFYFTIKTFFLLTDLQVSRQLLFALPNCTPPAIEQFPGTYFSPKQRTQGAIVLHIIVSLYMFLGLAIACDEYFVPSLEVLCDGEYCFPNSFMHHFPIYLEN